MHGKFVALGVHEDFRGIVGSYHHDHIICLLGVVAARDQSHGPVKIACKYQYKYDHHCTDPDADQPDLSVPLQIQHECDGGQKSQDREDQNDVFPGKHPRPADGEEHDQGYDHLKDKQDPSAYSHISVYLLALRPL